MAEDHYPYPSSAAVSAVMRANRKRDTQPEIRIRSELHRLGFRFRKNLLIRLPGLSVRPDIVFPRLKLAIFIDGCFWHCCPVHGNRPRANSAYWKPKLERNVERDRRVTAELKRNGWGVIRIWEHADLSKAIAAIADAVVEVRRTIDSSPSREPPPQDATADG